MPKSPLTNLAFLGHTFFYGNGKRIFRVSPSQALLTTDIQTGKLLEIAPSAFRVTRDEYQEWELHLFTQRIYQAERQKKFINYLEKKRDEKKIVDEEGADDLANNPKCLW